MNNRLNKYKYPGAKRLMLEAQELKDKTEDYCAQPIDDNLFEWHFTVRGPPDTAFEGGYYHGRLSFPTEYPMKPPSIILLTPNGRFTTNKKICLSISGYHPETWQPSWSVRTALLALIAFMPTKSHRAIGSLDFSDAERRKLAEKSRTWHCETCGPIKDLLKHPGQEVETDSSENIEATSEADATSRTRKDLKASTSNRSQVVQGDASKSDNQQCTHSPTINNSLTKNIGKEEVIKQSTTGPSSQIDQDNESNRNNCDEQDNRVKNADANSLTEGYSLSDAHPSTSSSIQYTRRVYPTLVYASIFILLFLLVLRRIVMLLQS